MRYHEIIPAPFDLIERRFAIRARDLGRAVTWFAPEVALGEARWPVVQCRIIAVRFDFATDAARFAARAFGRARWRAAYDTVYLWNQTSIDSDSLAEMSWARDRLDQLGMQNLSEIIDALIIDCTFRRSELVSAFADALNAGDLSDPTASTTPGHLPPAVIGRLGQ